MLPALRVIVPSSSPPAAPRFSVRARLASFRYAFRGIVLLVRTQHNARIHLAATAGVLVAGVVASLSLGEWCALILAISSVWTAEALNSGLEILADEVSLERRERIGQAKDLGAAGVLLSSLGAAAVGLTVLGRHLFGWLTN